MVSSPFETQIITDDSYLYGMQTPELAWLIHPIVNQSEVARRLGISASLLAKKLNGVQYKRFNDDELARLKQIHQDLLKELA